MAGLFTVMIGYLCILFSLSSDLNGFPIENRQKNALITEWGTYSGLPSDSVTDIVQTPDGYIWVGTKKGLARFDGVRFELFENSEVQGIKGAINALYVDNSGNLWVGTSTGLIKYKNRNFERIFGGSDEPGISVGSILQDSFGNLWFGTSDGAYKIAGERILKQTISSNGALISVNGIIEDNKGVIWVSTYTDGIYKLGEGGFERVLLPGDMNGALIRSLHEDINGDMWIGTSRGLLRYRNGVFRTVTESEGLNRNDIVAICESVEGYLWVGTINGLNRIRADFAGNIDIGKYLFNNYILSIFEDREHNLWVGTDGGGLKLLTDGVFRNIENVAGGMVVNALFQDKAGKIYMASGHGGVFLYEGGKYTPVQNGGRFRVVVAAIAQGSDDALWFGTIGEGLLRLKDGKVKSFSTRKGVRGNVAHIVVCGEDGEVFVVDNDGVIRFDGKKFRPVCEKSAIAGSQIEDICYSSDRKLYIAGMGLLEIYKGDKLVASHKTPGISCLYEDKEGVVWMGTSLNKIGFMKGGKPVMKRGFLNVDSLTMYQIVEDRLGYLWVSSDNGAIRVKRSDLVSAAEGDGVRSIVYGVSQGMKSSECSWAPKNSIAIIPRKGLWFATKKGVSVVEVEDIKLNKLPSPVIVEEVQVNRTSVRPEVLPEFYKLDIVGFRFTATSFVAPEKNRFYYKLEGYDKTWNVLGMRQKRFVEYRGLPVGEYVFKVRARNSDGVLNQFGDSFRFTVKGTDTKVVVIGIFAALFLAALVIWGVRKKKSVLVEINSRNSSSQEESVSVVDIAPADRELADKIEEMMRNKYIYRDPELSLKSFAGKLKITTHQLSFVVNECLGVSFTDLVNSWRINEAKDKLVNAEFKDQSILDIAYDAGFNSKPSFNRAFRKFTGVTPSEYRKNRGNTAE